MDQKSLQYWMLENTIADLDCGLLMSRSALINPQAYESMTEDYRRKAKMLALNDRQINPEKKERIRQLIFASTYFGNELEIQEWLSSFIERGQFSEEKFQAVNERIYGKKTPPKELSIGGRLIAVQRSLAAQRDKVQLTGQAPEKLSMEKSSHGPLRQGWNQFHKLMHRLWVFVAQEIKASSSRILKGSQGPLQSEHEASQVCEMGLFGNHQMDPFGGESLDLSEGLQLSREIPEDVYPLIKAASLDTVEFQKNAQAFLKKCAAEGAGTGSETTARGEVLKKSRNAKSFIRVSENLAVDGSAQRLKTCDVNFDPELLKQRNCALYLVLSELSPELLRSLNL